MFNFDEEKLKEYKDFLKKYKNGDKILINYIPDSLGEPLGTVIGKITEIEPGPTKNEWSISGQIIDFEPSFEIYKCENINLQNGIFFIYNGSFDKFLVKNLSAPLRLASKKLAFVSGIHERLGYGSLFENLPIDLIRQICESLNVLSERLPARGIFGGGKSKKNKKKSKKHKSKKRKRSSRNYKSKRKYTKRRR